MGKIDLFKHPNGMTAKWENSRVSAMPHPSLKDYVLIEFKKLITKNKTESEGVDWERLLLMFEESSTVSYIYRKNCIIRRTELVLSITAFHVIGAIEDQFRINKFGRDEEN